MVKQNPLTWNVAIVDRQGLPTKEFMQKWVTQGRINGEIPALSTAPEVSAVLDVLSSTPNDILLRGPSYWEGHPMSVGLDTIGSVRGDLLARKTSAWGRIASPADTTKFLNGATDPVWGSVHDSDLVLSDITTNNVSTSAHGFAPKAPNDVTKFLDGTGAYSVPAGGASGNMLGSWFGPSVPDATACATKMTEFWTHAGLTLAAVWIHGAPVASEAREARVFTGTGTWNDTHLGTLLGTSTNVAEPSSATLAGWYRWRRLAFSSPLTLAANTHYQVAIVRTDGIGSTVLHITAGNTGAGGDVQTPLGWGIHGESYGGATVNPVGGTNLTTGLGNAFASLAIVPEFTL